MSEMVERILIGLLALGIQDSPEINSKDISMQKQPVHISSFQNPSKLHIGFLSISLIVGLAYSGYTTYCCLNVENNFLSHIRNLVIALTFRTFFTLLFDAVVMLNDLWNVEASNTLLSFECICSNLVVAFWLVLTIYLYARVQKIFNKESHFVIYQFGVPGIALFFAFVWIFAMEGEYQNNVWWLVDFLNPVIQWITNSLRLLYLLIQLSLVVKMTLRMLKSSFDNDTVSLFKKVGIMLGLLIFLFWLEFGLSVGRSKTALESYLYFFYLVDGLQCTLACLAFFFLDKWVEMLQKSVSHKLKMNMESTERTNDEVIEYGDVNIFTIDSVLTTRQAKNLRDEKTEDTKDVVYSSVVQPDQLKKTLDFYKRVMAIPQSMVEKEEFYDCISDRSHDTIIRNVKDLNNQEVFEEQSKKTSTLTRKTKHTDLQGTQKNAFYSSKYLIVESKEKQFPKNLETRVPVSPEDEFNKAEIKKKDPINSVSPNTNEYVKTWLDTYHESPQELTNKAEFLKPQQIHKNTFNAQANLKKNKKRQDETMKQIEVNQFEQYYSSQKLEQKESSTDKKDNQKSFNNVKEFNNKKSDGTEEKMKIQKRKTEKEADIEKKKINSKLSDESESEFEVEKKKNSQSSLESIFSLDKYYGMLLKRTNNNSNK